ncbi:hypothetical protein CR51_22855 [Caballeronia megalochromosomata]|nr:hypothetical protein CR51_22855 [Caballeronia megalochromosomata]
MTDDRRERLERLSQGRIGVREIYIRLSLKPGSGRQGNMARRVILGGNIATFIFVVPLILAGLWILLSSRQGNFPSDILIAFSGVATAWGLYFRLVDHGRATRLTPNGTNTTLSRSSSCTSDSTLPKTT